MKRTCSQQRRIEGCSTANAFSCAADLDCGVIFYSLDQYTRRWVFIADDRLFDQVSRGLREEEKYICAFSHAMIALGYRMGRWTEIGFQSHRWKQGKMNRRLSTRRARDKDPHGNHLNISKYMVLYLPFDISSLFHILKK